MATLVYQAKYVVFWSFTKEGSSTTDPHHLTNKANPSTHGSAPNGKLEDSSPSPPNMPLFSCETHLWFKIDFYLLFVLDQLPMSPAQDREREHAFPLTTLLKGSSSWF